MITLPGIQDFIARNKWTFARTMPQWPHEYVVKERLSLEDQALFEQIAVYIRTFGRDERFLGTHPVRQYLYLDGWKYWTMGAPIAQTTILNRAQTDPEPYDQMQYETLFTSEEDIQEERELVKMVWDNMPRWATILDIGCGDGLLIRHMAHPPNFYTGIDPSARMLSMFCQSHPEYKDRLILTRAEDFRADMIFDHAIALHGSASYVPHDFWEAGFRKLCPEDSYFLTFFKEGYYPLTYSRSGIEASHFEYKKEWLEGRFEQVQEWGNYYVCTKSS
jgi:hypothetical protein